MRIWKQLTLFLIIAIAHAMLTLFLVGNAMVCADIGESCVRAIPRFLDYVARMPVFAILQLIDPPSLDSLPHPVPKSLALLVAANSLGFAALLYAVIWGLNRIRGKRRRS